MILLIDNYDSFTYNLVQYFWGLDQEVEVKRNDEITISQIQSLKPNHIVISPGPCTPKEAGVSVEVVQKLGKSIPLLGVCLGHQSIGAAFGASIIRAPYVMHGKVSDIHHNGKTIYKNLPNPFEATRYHSLIIDESTLPTELEVSSRTQDQLIMGVRHKEYPIEGVQFHPESIMTGEGMSLLKNFIQEYS